MGRVILCLVLEHVLLVLKFVVHVRVPDQPLWVLKAEAYHTWLEKQGEEHLAPSLQHAESLQSQYEDDDDDLERFWL